MTDCDTILAASYCSIMSERARDPKLKEQWLILATGCLSLAPVARPPLPSLFDAPCDPH